LDDVAPDLVAQGIQVREYLVRSDEVNQLNVKHTSIEIATEVKLVELEDAPTVLFIRTQRDR